MSIGELALWRAVIIRVAKDAFGIFAVTLHKQDKKRFKRDSFNWFNDSGRNFHAVCDLADLDPMAIKERFLRAYQNNDINQFIERGIDDV